MFSVQTACARDADTNPAADETRAHIVLTASAASPKIVKETGRGFLAQQLFSFLRR